MPLSRFLSFAIPALLLLQILFVAGYVGVEKTIYFWDHAMYFDMARQLFAAFGNSAEAGFAMFRQSLDNDYNLIFTLPSLLSFALFGETRLVFILTNFFAFFLPYELAAAWALRRLFGWRWSAATAASFATALLIPPLWLPLLEGYPDNGGAVGVTLALALLLGCKRGWRAAVAVGLALSFAILLRRHFVYPALALMMAAAAVDGAARLTARAGRWRIVAFYALAGGTVTATLFLIAPEFLAKALAVDYVALYASYKKPAGVFLVFMTSGLGWLLSAATLGGLAAAWRFAPQARRGLVILGLWFLAWLVLWCVGSCMAGHHYMLHTVPLLVTAGLCGFLARHSADRIPPPLRGRLGGGACRKLRTFILGKLHCSHLAFTGLGLLIPPPPNLPREGGGTRSALFVLLLLLVGNSAYALWFSGLGVKPNSNGGVGLLSAPRPPVVRTDYDALTALGRALMASTQPDDRLYVVASSFYLNQDLLARVFADALHEPAMAARFQWGPEIDGEQPPPLDVYASSTVYVVPEPAQYHLDPAGQTVVTAAARQFPPPQDRAGLFRRDAQSFTLEDGVVAHIWRRDAWTPDMLRPALASIRAIAAGAAQDWVAWRQPRGVSIRSDDRGLTQVTAVFDAARRDMILLFDRPLAAGDYRLGMAVASGCAAPRFVLETVAGDGKALSAASFAPVLLPSEAYNFFTIPPEADGKAFARLRMAVTTGETCLSELRELRIERAATR